MVCSRGSLSRFTVAVHCRGSLSRFPLAVRSRGSLSRFALAIRSLGSLSRFALAVRSRGSVSRFALAVRSRGSLLHFAFAVRYRGSLWRFTLAVRSRFDFAVRSRGSLSMCYGHLIMSRTEEPPFATSILSMILVAKRPGPFSSKHWLAFNNTNRGGDGRQDQTSLQKDHGFNNYHWSRTFQELSFWARGSGFENRG